MFAKLWPSISMGAVTVTGLYADQIQAFVSSHPAVTMVLGTVATLIANIVQSPRQPSA